jgi:hypothetical protein
MQNFKITANLQVFNGTYLNGVPKQGGSYVWPNRCMYYLNYVNEKKEVLENILLIKVNISTRVPRKQQGEWKKSLLVKKTKVLKDFML